MATMTRRIDDLGGADPRERRAAFFEVGRTPPRIDRKGRQATRGCSKRRVVRAR